MMGELDELSQEILACTKCELRASATNPVCGFGNPNAKYFIIGEAPGREEDTRGIPFIGKAGRRLDKLLALGGIDFDDCYIANTVRCRPPSNRKPRKKEIATCKDYLLREIALVDPEVIIVLGSIPLSLVSPYGVRQLHGTMFEYEIAGKTRTIISQYHPAAALHQPRLWSAMRDDWQHLPDKVDSDYVVVSAVKSYPGLVSLDTENAPDGSLGCWSVVYRNGGGLLCAEPLYGRVKGKTYDQNRVIMHNAKWDLRVLARHKMSLPTDTVCTMIAAYCLGMGKSDVSATANKDQLVGGLGLKYLARRHLGMTMNTWQEVYDHPAEVPEYNIKDSVATYLLWEKFSPQLPQHFWDIDMPLLSVLMKMEDRGIMIDPTFLAAFGEELDTKLSGISLPFNPFSTPELQKYVYKDLGVQPFMWTKGGKPSVAAEVLETIDDPVIKEVLRYKGLYKERGTYVQNYMDKIDKDGRIHPTFKQTSTATGRLSCAQPNLQNAEVGEMRKLFIAPPGFVLVRADWSQVELRVFAALAHETNMLRVFAEGRSIHQETADFLGCTYYQAKTINFLMLYGGSAWRISQEFHIPIDKAKAMLERYYTLYPGIKHYQDQIEEEVRASKEVSDWFGRTRKIDALLAEDWRVQQAGIREAINMPIQGTAAEIVKRAMLKLEDEPMLLQVHDELIFEIPESMGIDYAHWLNTYLPGLTQIEGTEFPVEVSVGANWYECCLDEKKIKEAK